MPPTPLDACFRHAFPLDGRPSRSRLCCGALTEDAATRAHAVLFAQASPIGQCYSLGAGKQFTAATDSTTTPIPTPRIRDEALSRLSRAWLDASRGRFHNDGMSDGDTRPDERPYDAPHLARNPANHAALTPLGFLERAASVYPDKIAVIDGDRRFTSASSTGAASASPTRCASAVSGAATRSRCWRRTCRRCLRRIMPCR